MQKRSKTPRTPKSKKRQNTRRRATGQELFATESADSVAVAENQLALLVRTTALLTPGPPGPRTLDRSSYLLLRTLDENGPSTISTLAAELCLAGSTVTRQVGAMCAAGLVRSTADPADRRVRVVTIEPHGHEMFTAERQQRRRVLRAITGDWTEEERGQLALLLAKLNRSLTELFDTAALAPGV